MNKKLVVNAVSLPTLSELEAGGQGYVLYRFGRKSDLPDHITLELESRGYLGIPTVNINSPLTGEAVVALRKIKEQMDEGKQLAVHVEFDPEDLRISGTGDKLYLNLSPKAVMLNRPEEVESPYVGLRATQDDNEYARALNKAAREASSKRIAKLQSAREEEAIQVGSTPSGSLVVNDDSTPF